MYKLNLMDKISFILVILGAINWGLIGLFNFNLVAAIFGEPAPMIARIIYILVGIAGLNMILTLIKMRNSTKV
ncbi:MAG: hypothetical protein K0R54_4163 [Clostridiaceae bacterium]|jgi:uncharacterized membrane protein YuzA (DUF378 family)|nr:hypothetical protein [Clostridiaceae bacterium]